jgi:hypothetical protein
MSKPQHNPAPTGVPANNNGGDDKLLVQLTAADLRALIRAEVEQVIAAGSTRSTGRWVDVGVAAKHFSCTGQTIRNWIRLGAPARQIGTSAHPQFRIDLSEFEAWVRSHRR